MGFLANLLGYIPPEQPPVLVSFFPSAAADMILHGKLLTIQTDKLILASGEVCHFVDIAAAITEKQRRQSIHAGSSYRIGKGFTMHSGRSESVPVSEPTYTKGVLYITNQRIVFTASKNGFDKRLKALTAVTPYSNGVALQYGSKTYTLLSPNGEIIKRTLDLLL